MTLYNFAYYGYRTWRGLPIRLIHTATIALISVQVLETTSWKQRCTLSVTIYAKDIKTNKQAYKCVSYIVRMTDYFCAWCEVNKLKYDNLNNVNDSTERAKKSLYYRSKVTSFPEITPKHRL